MLHPAANRHPKATHQWLLMGVQACRLPALKPLKPFKRLKPLKTLKPLKRLLGMLHPAANRHPKATHQWLLMGVQACRLPALKPLKPFKRLKPLKTLKPLKRWLGMLHLAANSHPRATHQWLLMGRLNNPLACFILQPTGTPRLHINGFLWASKPAVCQPLNPVKPFKRLKPLKTLKPLKRLLGMLHPAANRHPKATHQWLLMGRLNIPLACFIGCWLQDEACQVSVLRVLRFLRVLSVWRVLQGLRAGKRQAWTPIRSHWCVALGCLLAAGWSMPRECLSGP